MAFARSVEPSIWNNLLRSPWLRPLNDLGAVDDLLQLVRADWSLTAIRARVVECVRETADTTTLVLEPNRLWPGHTAGQHVLVEIEKDGRRLHRTFSIASSPRADGRIAITVKRREAGKVSGWWNDVARIGDVVTLSRPAGEFVLPGALPERVVMISAGSGITPLMAMLRDLDSRDHRSTVLFVHSARSKRELIFAAELEALVASRPWFDLRLHFTADVGRMTASDWARLASESAGAATYVCGPDGFAADVREAWIARGIDPSLRMEHFGAPVRRSDDSSSFEVTAARSTSTFAAVGGETLLVAAEKNGLRPAYGCRAGICHTCKCRKLSGIVEDLRDGRISDEPGEMIQLCVTTARSAVTLEL